MIRFRLLRAARLVLIVRGPGPSCETVARIAFRGRQGANRLRFNGRIAGKPLAPGTYVLTPRLRKRKADLGRAFVTIVATGRKTPAHVRPDCTEPQQPARTFLAGSFLGGEEGAGPGSETASAASVAGAVPAPAPSAPAPFPNEDVRGEESPLFGGLPTPSSLGDADGLPVFLGLAVLALLGVSLAGVIVEVVRHLRSPRF